MLGLEMLTRPVKVLTGPLHSVSSSVRAARVSGREFLYDLTVKFVDV